MTATVVRTDRPAPSAPAAAVALAGAEGRRLVRSPFFTGGLLLTIALGVAWAWTRMPTWDTFGQNAGMSSLVLAAAVLIATHLATGRDRRAGAEESTRTMPTGPGRRGLAMLVVVPITALAGAGAYLIELLLLLPTWPVGAFDPWAAAAVVVIPPIGALIGLLAGRVLPGVAAGPLTSVAVVVVLFFLLLLPSGTSAVPGALWPVPDLPWEVGAPSPTGWHLLYLVGLLTALIALVTRRVRPLPSIALLIAAVVLSGLAVHQQARNTIMVISDELAEPLTGVPALRCRTHADVRYCALPHYEGWIAHWRDAVEPVASRLPPGAARPAVRQLSRGDDGRPMSPGTPETTVSTSWGRIGPWAADSRSRMARDYAATAVGLLRRDSFQREACDAAGQHRTVAALWLLAVATPGGPARLEQGDLRLPRVRYGPAEVQATLGLLAHPEPEVAAYLAAHWPAVLNPSKPALAAIGVTLKPPPVPPAPTDPSQPSRPTKPNETVQQSQPGNEGGVCR